jgi:hypothetical protein
MKHIFNNILVLVAATLTLAACNLDLFPTTAIVYDETQPVIQKQSDLTSFENNIMANFRGTQSGSFYSLDDVMCDAFNATVGYGNNFGPIHRTNEDFTASDQDVEGFWGSYYSVIKNYNIAINAANTIADPALREAAKVMKGEAFLFRAYSYMQLARHFGKAYDPSTASSDLCVPLILVYDQLERPFRNTVEEVYDQIGKDLDSAAVFLAEVPGQVRAMRPTIDLVKAMKARYALDTRDYATAAELAQSVIDGGLYKLASTEEEFEAEYDNDEGTEPIVQLYASLSEGPNGLGLYTGYGTVTGVGNVFQPYFLPSQKLLDTYEEDDLRKVMWFLSADNVPVYENGTAHSDEDLYTFIKCIGSGQYTNSGVPNGQTAIKPIRIGELYLIAAEAYQKNGANEKAKTALNALQAARGATETTASEENIRKEWFRETVGDGLRMSCLKRWGTGFTARTAQPAALSANVVMTGTYFEQKSAQASDYFFQWPIPTYEMQTNLNIAKQQNPGYAVVEE